MFKLLVFTFAFAQLFDVPEHCGFAGTVVCTSGRTAPLVTYSGMKGTHRLSLLQSWTMLEQC